MLMNYNNNLWHLTRIYISNKYFFIVDINISGKQTLIVHLNSEMIIYKVNKPIYHHMILH